MVPGIVAAVIFIIIIVLILYEAVRIKLVFDTDKTEYMMSFFWLYPIFSAFITFEEMKLRLDIYLFNKRISSRIINIYRKKEMNPYGRKKKVNLLKIVEPEDVRIDFKYGFKDPFFTGIACGAVNIASQFFHMDYYNQTPDFIASEDYISVNATAKVNLGSLTARYLKSRFSN